MNKRFAFIPITGLMLLTLGGCATTPNGNGAANTGNTTSVGNNTGTTGNTASVGNTTSPGNVANNVQVSVDNTPNSQSNYASQITLIEGKGYSVSQSTPDATVKTSSGATLSAWLGVSGSDGHNQYVFFFLNGAYLGTDTAKPSLEITSAKASGNGIAVTYPVYMANDSFAFPTGTPVTITYTWTGSKLVPDKPYPKQFQTGSGADSSPSNHPPFTTLSMVNSNTGWATGGNSVWMTTDGTHWKNVSPLGLSNSSNTQATVFGLDNQQAWIAVSNPSIADNKVTIWHTSNGGHTWSQQHFSDVGYPLTLQFRNAKNGLMSLMQGAAAGSESETIYQTSNGGTSWSKVGVANYGGSGDQIPFGGDKTGASFLDKSHGWATGFTPVNGRIYLYRTTNGGQTWNLQPVTVPTQLENAELSSYPPIFFGTQDGVLVVSDGSTLVVYRTTDGGQTWAYGSVVERTVQNEAIQAWSFPTFDDGFATDGNKVFATTDGGRTWSSFNPNISLRDAARLQFTSSKDGWVLMNSGALYRTTDGGLTWVRD